MKIKVKKSLVRLFMMLSLLLVSLPVYFPTVSSYAAEKNVVLLDAETVADAEAVDDDVNEETKLMLILLMGGALIIIIAVVISVASSVVSSVAAAVDDDNEE